jgi:fucose 4-O-acetylase-like acetyltransferase
MTDITARDTSASTGQAGKRVEQESSERLVWLDAAKGLGIILVVLGHALGGLIDAGVASTAQRNIFFAVYTFHMPLFFFLSGLTVRSRVERNPARFARLLGPTLVWPYMLWSIAQVIVIWAAGAMVNRPLSDPMTTILAIPTAPVSQFWFLWVLFFYHVAAWSTLPRWTTWQIVGVAAALRIAEAIVPLPVIIALLLREAIWYALGLALSQRLLRAWPVRPSLSRVAAIIAVAVIAIIVAEMRTPAVALLAANAAGIARLAGFIWIAPATAAAIAAVVLCAEQLNGAPAAALAWLGRRSMPIFILHVMAVAGARILLLKSGGAVGPLTPVLLTLIGLGLPLLAFEIACRLRLARPLGLA